jgi:NAD(P)-dependent dehydrogenase (short-subunit alcohol dehydrogenase family)
VPFLKTDVTDWDSQLALFKAAEQKFGKIDHVFANAGIGHTETFLEEEVDEDGDLLPPGSKTLDVNFTGCLYTVKLGVFYLRKSWNPRGGSIVVTASVSSFSRFPPTDYSTFPLFIFRITYIQIWT